MGSPDRDATKWEQSIAETKLGRQRQTSRSLNDGRGAEASAEPLSTTKGLRAKAAE